MAEEFELLDLEKIWFSEEYNREISNIQNYFEIRNQLRQFTYKCTLKTFQRLFEADAERLWKHFFQDCEANLEKFETYLTKEQMNVFIVNGLLNKKMFL